MPVITIDDFCVLFEKIVVIVPCRLLKQMYRTGIVKMIFSALSVSVSTDICKSVAENVRIRCECI